MRESWKETAQFLKSKKEQEDAIMAKLIAYYDNAAGAKAQEL